MKKLKVGFMIHRVSVGVGVVVGGVVLLLVGVEIKIENNNAKTRRH
jgi:hypothetical protein